MYKNVALLSVAKGKNPDEVWKYWIDPHAANHKNVPTLKKYVLNRIIKASGEFPFWGMAAGWYDSEEAYNRPNSITIPKDDFASMIGKERITASLEEKVIIEGGKQGMYKRMAVFSLAKGKDSDEVWKYWIETHAANHKNVPGIKKYVLNRVIKASGEMPFWGMAEQWFDNEEAYNKFRSIAGFPKDDFASMHGAVSGALVEEKVILDTLE